MRKLFFILLVLATSCMMTKSQGFVIEYIASQHAYDGLVVNGIVFRDTVNKVDVKRIDVHKLNPFAALPFPQAKGEEDMKHIFQYDLQGKMLKDIVPANVLERNRMNVADTTQAQYASYVEQVTPLKEYAIIVYTMHLGDKYTRWLSYSHLYMYKPDGTELLMLKDSPDYLTSPVINTSGRFLACTWVNGGPETSVYRSGVWVMDLKNQHQFIDFDGVVGESKFIDENLYYTVQQKAGDDTGDEKWVHVLNLESGKKYSLEFSVKSMGYIKAVTKDGIVFTMGSKVMFDKDVRGEELLWKSWNGGARP